MPLVLRLAGLWLIWAAWCSVSGWVLSAIHRLDGWGHVALLPVLGFAWWQWLKATASKTFPSANNSWHRLRRRLRRPLPLIYLTIAALSLLGGLLHVPWSSDALSYRFPRLLYWWGAHQWQWIGTVDHRLDFSSCGFEWQLLPLLELTHSDRLLFLLNWIPFLLLPGLTFFVFRALGTTGRSARRWMWLLPAGYCFALQAGSVQNDGYSVNYLLGAIGCAVVAFRTGRTACFFMALIAAGLLTGAKLSNLPLYLPLGVLLLTVLPRVRWISWKTPVVLGVALLTSFAPISLLSLKHTGDWAGDPTDQWNVKTHDKLGGLAANVVFFVNDALQPPLFPLARQANQIAGALQDRAQPVMQWLERSHGHFGRMDFGEMVYEGGAGLGFGIGMYLLLLGLGSLFVKVGDRTGSMARELPWAWRAAPWLAWISYAVLLMKLGSPHTARIAAPFYPLLIISLLRRPRLATLEAHKLSGVLAGFAAMSVLPVIFLTPSRPLIPIQTLADVSGKPALKNLAGKYKFWGGLRDDLAPLRDALPPGVTKLGYAGGFLDSSYCLWKPFGSRVVVEMGLPLGGDAKPPAGLDYAVVTARGLQDRYAMDLPTWLGHAGAEVVFQFDRNVMLDAHSPAKYETWYLVKLHR